MQCILFILQFKIMVFITMIMMHQKRCISVALCLLSGRVQLEAYYLPRKRTRLHHYSRFQKDKHERATKYQSSVFLYHLFTFFCTIKLDNTLTPHYYTLFSS